MSRPQAQSACGGRRPAGPLVLGARSLIGRRLLPLLRDPAAPVLAVSRAPQPAQPGVRWRVQDLCSPDAFEGLEAVSTVFSLSPIWLLPPLAPRLLEAGADRVLAVSSTSRFTKTASSDPGERALARRLAEAETAAFAAFPQGRLTVIRPTLIYAEGEDRNVSRLAGLIERFGVLPLCGRGEGRRQPVHADDLAQGVLAAARSPATLGGAYDAPGGEVLSYREMAERIFDALGRPRRILPTPPWLWRTALSLLSPLLPGATAGMGERMAEDLVFDPEPAARDFGWSPRPFHPRFQS